MKLYEIIKDEALLLDFIDWLPELQDNEVFYLSLFARRKYSPDVLIKANDRTQLRRFVISSKDKFIDEIKELELPLGRWKLRNIEVPQESLVLYINPNPRCMKKATAKMGKKCWDLMNNDHFRIDIEAMSCIQTSKSRTCYVDFDIDSKDIDLSKLKDILLIECYNVLETKGGFHVLVNPAKAEYLNSQAQKFGKVDKSKFPLNWYKAIQDTFDVDQSGDQMIPVPGCTQGNFVPKFVKI